MSKRLIIVMSLALGLGLIATLAYAEVQNIKVSGDLTMRSVYREAFTLQDTEWSCGTENSDSRDTYFLSTARVRFDADLTDNVAVAVRLLNERAWGDTQANNNLSENDDEIDIDLAYLTLKEFLYSPLMLTVGRQELRFGNALIVGDPDTNLAATTWTGVTAATYIMPAPDLSARKAFDSIRATLDYSPWVFDLIYAKIDENDPNIQDDIDLKGINLSYDVGDNNNTVAEVYYFERDAATNTPNAEDDVVRTAGVRAQSMPIGNLLINAELAHQSGTYVNNNTIYPNDTERNVNMSDKRDAWAMQLGVDYLLSDMKYTPAIGLWYTFLSGEKDGTMTGDTYRGWHPMFEDQGGGTIYNAMVATSNCHVINVNGSMKPSDDLTASLMYTHIILDKPYVNGSSQRLSGIITNPAYTMTDRDHLGDEFDVLLAYDYTEDVQLGLNAGIFIPGTAFEEANDRSAYQLIGSMKVTF